MSKAAYNLGVFVAVAELGLFFSLAEWNADGQYKLTMLLNHVHTHTTKRWPIKTHINRTRL